MESDLEMYFPDTYVPGSSERMLLYRELDNITDDRELDAYRQRLIARFGPVPHEGEERLQVVPLRRLGKRLGCEKLILKQDSMRMQCASYTASSYYLSQAFVIVLRYIGNNPRRCNLKEISGKHIMIVSGVKTVGVDVAVLREIDS